MSHISLDQNWLVLQSQADEFASAEEAISNSNWLPALVPGTACSSLQSQSLWQVESNLQFDDFDWWYQTEFEEEENAKILCFEGLATIADVWLNGELILQTNNMFVAHQVDIEALLKPSNRLVICFRSLTKNLQSRHPRPRWKTKLVNNQNLRWYRTTLLGRIPGWTPPIAPVGPWRPIYLKAKSAITQRTLHSSLEGEIGILELDYAVSKSVEVLEASIELDSNSYPLVVKCDSDNQSIYGNVKIPKVKKWWPHTHGKAHLYQAKLHITTKDGSTRIELGKVGFKKIEINQSEGSFEFRINDSSVFCRGACWTINDINSLTGNSEDLSSTLNLMKAAGTNIIRIGGTMIYESKEFHKLCDELGLMVWQDFMFANMDYPFDDQDFLKNIREEVIQVVSNLSQHVSTTLFCGNSEVEQQVAMQGFPKEMWQSEFFHQELNNLCKKHAPAIPYVTSSPFGEPLPFLTKEGVCHFYGVGAYLEDVQQVRNHDVKFTSECLGFSNLPTTKTRESVLNGTPIFHDSKWKSRIPKDVGAGWDFEDVRDHYLESLFSLDPVKTRSFDLARYIQVSELVTGEMMSQTFNEWRSAHSNCSGGIVWFLKDLWEGAGWGIIDSNNLPKACYYYLKRAWQAVFVSVTDENLNGLDFHLINDSPNDIEGRLVLRVVGKHSESLLVRESDVKLNKRSITVINSNELIGSFFDLTNSYKFGALNHQVVSIQLINEHNEVISENFYFPDHSVFIDQKKAELKFEIKEVKNNLYQLDLYCEHFLYGVNIDLPGFLLDANFFHLLPKQPKQLTIQRCKEHTKPLRGFISALNLEDEIRVKYSG